MLKARTAKKTDDGASRPKRKSLMLPMDANSRLDRLSAEFRREKSQFVAELLVWFDRQSHWTKLWAMGLLGPSQEAFERHLHAAAEAVGETLSQEANSSGPRRERAG